MHLGARTHPFVCMAYPRVCEYAGTIAIDANFAPGVMYAHAPRETMPKRSTTAPPKTPEWSVRPRLANDSSAETAGGQRTPRSSL